MAAARLNASLSTEGGVISAIHCFTEYPSPVGMTVEAWFEEERARGRGWRIDSEIPSAKGHTVYISRS